MHESIEPSFYFFRFLNIRRFLYRKWLLFNFNKDCSEMKKLLLALSVISLSACASSHYKGAADVDFKTARIIPEPMEVEVIPEKTVTASAECNSYLFGLFGSEPTKLMFGPELIESEGNFAPSACTRGALFKAMEAANADTILMPRYTAQGQKLLCIPFLNSCLINKAKVTIKGIAGKYSNIRKITDTETSRKIKIQTAGEKKTALTGSFF